MVATSGKGWKLAPSLVQFVEEIDERWPNRPKTSDGSIGDAAHAARKSEHNPDRDSDPMPAGYVSAVDITKMSAAGMEEIRKAAIADPRTWYVIHDGYIWSRTYGFRKRKYTGSNPHKGHLHLSLMQTATAARAGSWGIAEAKDEDEPKKPSPPKKTKRPTIQKGDAGEDVALVQRFLGVRTGRRPIVSLVDKSGEFGHVTDRAVRRYQQMRGLVVDGIVGPKTWADIESALG